MFCLRKFTSEKLEYKNEVIAPLTVHNEHVHSIGIRPNDVNCVYQIYPAQKNRTFYTIEQGMTLFVFAKNVNGEFEYCCESHEPDVYLYFTLIKEMHCGVAVVVARSRAAAARSAAENK